jgi:hypothetical protein
MEQGSVKRDRILLIANKTSGYMGKPVGILLLVLGVIVLPGCGNSTSMEPKQFTQCMGKVGPDGAARPESTKGLLVVSEQKCYALRWSIPLAYMPSQISPYGDMRFKMGVPDMTPGAYFNKALDAAHPTEVRIASLLMGNFLEQRVNHTMRVYGGGYGLKNSGRVVNGFEIYESTKALTESHVVLLHSQDPTQPILVCTVGRRGTINQLFPDTGCRVTTNVDGHFSADYDITYSQLPQFEQLNAAVVARIRSFIVQ